MNETDKVLLENTSYSFGGKFNFFLYFLLGVSVCGIVLLFKFDLCARVCQNNPFLEEKQRLIQIFTGQIWNRLVLEYADLLECDLLWKIFRRSWRQIRIFRTSFALD